jgi:DNA-binding transcriptional ArsR family regulator
MMSIRNTLRVVDEAGLEPGGEQDRLDRVFFALSDPVRRQILERLDGPGLLVSELAAPFEISLQAVSRHIQVLVRAGLIQQQRSGRISKCSLEAGPLLDTAVWINRYSKYWQQQFDVLVATLAEIDARKEEQQETVSPRKRPDKTSTKRKRATRKSKPQR